MSASVAGAPHGYPGPRRCGRFARGSASGRIARWRFRFCSEGLSHLLHTVCNPDMMSRMRTATTIGFAVEEGDRARLDHLAAVFAGGNRSAFLRTAITVMEQLDVPELIERPTFYQI